MNILGALLALAAFVIAIWIGGDIYAFIDISSILFVGGGIFAAIIARHGFSGFKSLFNPNEGVEVYATVATAGMASGVLGSLIGLVSMLGNLSDPTTIGPAVAMSLLSSFYGVLVYLLIYILNKNIELNSSK